MTDIPSINLDGASYPLVTLDDMTMREQRDFEKIAGAGVDKLETLQDEWRAGLIVAWMAVSIHREKPTTPIGQIVDRLDEMKPADIRAAWEDVVGPNPPDEKKLSAVDDGETRPGNSSEPSSAPPQENATPNGSGSPHSVDVADFAPVTSEL